MEISLELKATNIIPYSEELLNIGEIFPNYLDSAEELEKLENEDLNSFSALDLYGEEVKLKLALSVLPEKWLPSPYSFPLISSQKWIVSRLARIKEIRGGR